MNRRERFIKKHNSTFALNINSMTDMFTIMLVFLLQTYSTNAYEIKPVKDLRMPNSISDKAAEDAPMVSLSKTDLFLGDKKVVSVPNFSFPKEVLDQGQIIQPLLAQLNEIKSSGKSKDEIILQIDRDCPYPSLQPILSTITMAGFINVRFATISGN